MSERQPCGMEERPVEVSHRANMAGDAASHAAVQSVTNNRMTYCAEVDPNLVSTAGMDGNLNERERGAELFCANDARNGLPAAPRACRHLFPMLRVASDRSINPSSRLDVAPHQSHILLFHLAIA